MRNVSYRVAPLSAFPVAYALAGEAKPDSSLVSFLRNNDQGRLLVDRAPLFSQSLAARLYPARSPHSSHSDPRQIPYRCSCQLTRAIWTAQYPFFPSGGFSLLKLDLHLVNQFTVFGGKVMILLGTLHELFPEAMLFVFHSFSLLNFKESSEVYRTFPDPPLASLQAPAHGSYP
jgi:hypothetical protein